MVAHCSSKAGSSRVSSATFATQYYTDEPGFDSVEAIEDDLYPLSEGDEVGFNVLTSLLYWDGTQKTTPANDPELEISAGFSTVVTPTSGPQAGFIFGTADATGVHEHLDFTLTPGSDAGAGAAPVGAYGLWLELTSPQYESSDPFLIVINQGLGEDDFENGVDAMHDMGVPEPSTLGLLASSLVGVALTRRRRIPAAIAN